LRLLFPKPYADFVARLRVPCGFVLVAAFAWFSHPDARSLAYGVPVSLMGLAVRAWAAGHLAKNRALATGGPYAYTRNPLYLGTLLVAAGLAIAARSAGLGALFAAVFLGIYLPVIQLEQQHLCSLFSGIRRVRRAGACVVAAHAPRGRAARVPVGALHEKSRVPGGRRLPGRGAVSAVEGAAVTSLVL